jgi:hypothetical protein
MMWTNIYWHCREKGASARVVWSVLDYKIFVCTMRMKRCLLWEQLATTIEQEAKEVEVECSCFVAGERARWMKERAKVVCDYWVIV